MKLKNTILSLLALVALSLQAFGQGSVDAVFNVGATGTTSATAIVPAALGTGQITDLATRLDAGLTTGTIEIRNATTRKAVTSATSASGTQLWFTNTGTAVGVSSYVIYFNAAAGSYTLVKALAATTTSITATAAITPATATTDFVYPLAAVVSRPVSTATSTSTPASIWIPSGMPAALTLDGNTTACRIAVSGVRSEYK